MSSKCAMLLAGLTNAQVSQNIQTVKGIRGTHEPPHISHIKFLNGYSAGAATVSGTWSHHLY